MSRSSIVPWLLGLAGGILLAGDALAGAPDLVSYQGVLTKTDGTVVPPGSYDLSFKLCDAAAAGTCTAGQTLTVTVTDGLYNVLLSDPTLIDDFRSGSYPYLEVRAETGPPGSGAPITLTPRQQIASVPFALVAGNTSDAVASPTAQCPGPAGTLRYVANPPSIEVCDGTTWINPSVPRQAIILWDQPTGDELCTGTPVAGECPCGFEEDAAFRGITVRGADPSAAYPQIPDGPGVTCDDQYGGGAAAGCSADHSQAYDDNLEVGELAYHAHPPLGWPAATNFMTGFGTSTAYNLANGGFGFTTTPTTGYEGGNQDHYHPFRTVLFCRRK